MFGKSGTMQKDSFLETVQSSQVGSVYVSILETLIEKNNIFFLVFDKTGTILFQNIPNGSRLKTLDDLVYLLPQKNIDKIRKIMELSFEDAVEITTRDGFLEFVLFSHASLPGRFFLQVKMHTELDATQLAQDPKQDSRKQTEQEMQDMQMVQAFLLELKELETIEPTEENRKRVKDYFLPQLEIQEQLVKDPLTLICLDIIKKNLDEMVDASGTMGKLYKVLTPSEVKVAEFIRMGMSSKDIANTLEITQKTVENHRNNLREKLGLKNKGVNLQVFLMNMGEEEDSQ
ncbi:helix-turn-helix transcriptional regulator [Sphaerochaeta sp.]|uniref:helix-turn-helix transcriptional regulator n=1 Tax=Sphaerochaeta sp. TaxID=1972642 RepID=UPI002FCC75DA